MKARVRWAGVAFAMLLAAPCLAAGSAPDSTKVRTGAIPGRGGVGGLLGGSLFYAADDFSKGALPRFSFDAHYRYVFSSRVRAQASPGFTWAAYSKKEPPPFVDPAFPTDQTKENYLALLVPISAQLQLTMGKRPWLYYLGAGPGLYRVWVQDHRKVLRDPDPGSLELHRGLFWGFTAEVGVERFLKALPSTSVEVALASHYVFSEDTQKFPSGWNSKIGVMALRVGANYYFDLKKPKKSSEVQLPIGAR
jgi:hypothetical protein